VARLGLLACDFVPDELRDRFEDYPVMFAEAIASTGTNVELQTYRVYQGELPQHTDECDAYLISGARAGAYDGDAWIAALEVFIRALAASERPLVGVCFGHQVIAQALGGKVEKSPRGWGIGVNTYEADQPAPWMNPALPQFTVPVCHQDQVVQLPAGARRLAHSDQCENFLLQFNDTMMGIQGHPEFTRAYVGVLIDLRANLLAPETLAAARASLDQRGDNVAIMHWITNFLELT
jgi:GMP synthase-like glutamine amidotransferase